MNDNFTIKELYAAIKKETMAVNKRLVSYYDEGKTSKLVEKEIDVLRDVSGTSSKRPYLSMNLHRKNKNQLIAQLNFLRDFQAWDILTPEGRRENEAAARKAYKSYKQNRPAKHLKFKTYRRAVTIIGSMSPNIISAFLSEAMMEAIETAFRHKRSADEIIRTFEKVYNENKNKGWYGDDYIDEWYRQMNL